MLKNDTASKPVIQVDHNVQDQFNISGSGGFAMTEDYNIYTDNNQWSFNIGAHSVLNSSPGFIDPAHDDYRLANNSNNIGVTWKPSDFTYGPAMATNTGGSGTQQNLGDVNGDKKVSILDLSLVLANYGKTSANWNESRCDINGDGKVTVLDLSVVLSKYGTMYP
jgi:hypothetical protein